MVEQAIKADDDAPMEVDQIRQEEADTAVMQEDDIFGRWILSWFKRSSITSNWIFSFRNCKSFCAFKN